MSSLVEVDYVLVEKACRTGVFPEATPFSTEQCFCWHRVSGSKAGGPGWSPKVEGALRNAPARAGPDREQRCSDPRTRRLWLCLLGVTASALFPSSAPSPAVTLDFVRAFRRRNRGTTYVQTVRVALGEL